MTLSHDIQIAVIVLSGGAALQACLSALEGAEAAVTVYGPPTGVAKERPLDGWAGIRFTQSTTYAVPLRRLKAARASRARIVAFLEDTTAPQADWVGAIAEAFRDERLGALGGPVAIPPTLGPRERAFGWAEYGRFVDAMDGSAETVPGNNMAYRRDALLAALEGVREGLIEHQVCARLRSLGFTVALSSAMSALLTEVPREGVDLKGRFWHGHLYGGALGAGLKPWARGALAMRHPLLPPLLTARQAAQMRRSRGAIDWPALLAALPANVAWATGETVGILAGPGTSLERWR